MQTAQEKETTMDYDDIINTSWDNVPEPQLIPTGNWLLKGTTAAFVKPREEGQAYKVLLTYKAQSPVQVPEDLLEEMEGYDFSINDLTFTIFVEKASDWNNVRKHLALHGIELDGRIVEENGKLAFAKKFRGAEAVAYIDQRSYEKNGETVWQNSLSKFQPVGD